MINNYILHTHTKRRREESTPTHNSSHDQPTKKKPHWFKTQFYLSSPCCCRVCSVHTCRELAGVKGYKAVSNAHITSDSSQVLIIVTCVVLACCSSATGEVVGHTFCIQRDNTNVSVFNSVLIGTIQGTIFSIFQIFSFLWKDFA